jgi:hypothetical protein
MKKFLKVFVYGNNLGDSTNGGISFTDCNDLVVPCERGNYTEDDVNEMGLQVLELRPCAMRGYPPHFIPYGETRWTMFGGNFVYNSDSRFSQQYGASPIKVYDRLEVK